MIAVCIQLLSVWIILCTHILMIGNIANKFQTAGVAIEHGRNKYILDRNIRNTVNDDGSSGKLFSGTYSCRSLDILAVISL